MNKHHKLGSAALIQQQRRNAATAFVSRARKPNAEMTTTCFGGLPRHELCGSALHRITTHIPDTQKQQPRQQRTKHICENRRHEVQLRRGGRGLTLCLAPTIRLGGVTPTAVPGAPARVHVVPRHTSTAFLILPSARVSVRLSLYSCVRVAHDIVVADMKRFSKCANRDAAIVMIYAIGLGNLMIADSYWQGSRPWQGVKAIRYQARAKATRVTFVAGSHLQFHRNAMQALCACSEEVTWPLVTEMPAFVAGQHLVHLDELPIIRAFLCKDRRVYHHKDAHGKFQNK